MQKITRSKNLLKQFFKKENVIHYLHHPRSKNNNELYFYKELFNNKIKNIKEIPLEEYIYYFKPKTIIAVGISSFFYRKFNPSVNIISLFKKDLINQKKYYKDIYLSYENY